MPTYDYTCSKCGQEFEFQQSIRDEPLSHCPKEKCSQKRWGKGKVKRLISTGAGILFKGSGFYVTDYRSEGYKAAAKKDSGAAETSKPAADTKPAGDSKSTGDAAKPKTETKKAAEKNTKSTPAS